MPDEATRQRRIAETAERLEKAVQQLDEDVQNLDKHVARLNKRTTIKIRVLVGVLAVQAAVVTVLAGVVQDNRHTRDEVLCPLYKIFVDSYNPESLAAKAQGIAQYTATFTEIHRQYQALGCAQAPRR